MDLVSTWHNWLAALFQHPSLGVRGERLAARHLKRKGYKIVARGQRGELGEIDLIAVDGRTIVFVEVKTRASHEAGHPTEAVNERKQRQLTRLAAAFLRQHGLLEYPARFDVIAITWPKTGQPRLEHYQDAFAAAGLPGMFT